MDSPPCLWPTASRQQHRHLRLHRIASHSIAAYAYDGSDRFTVHDSGTDSGPGDGPHQPDARQRGEQQHAQQVRVLRAIRCCVDAEMVIQSRFQDMQCVADCQTARPKHYEQPVYQTLWVQTCILYTLIHMLMHPAEPCLSARVSCNGLGTAVRLMRSLTFADPSPRPLENSLL